VFGTFGYHELSFRLFQVFIAVQNENDNTPLTVEPVYYPSIPENSPSGKVVVELKAEDYDLDPSQRLAFRITAGNPGGFFSINPDTGK
jgi:protocadherin Fat 1/2/3